MQYDIVVIAKFLIEHMQKVSIISIIRAPYDAEARHKPLTKRSSIDQEVLKHT